MGRRKYDVEQVRRVLDEVVAEDPGRVDRRAEVEGMSCRYTEHGACACLAAHILNRLGFSVGKLKALDRAAEGDPIALSVSGLHTRFTPTAFEMLCYLQGLNDRGWSWGRARTDTLSLDVYYGGWNKPRKHRTGKPWLAETEPLNGQPEM